MGKFVYYLIFALAIFCFYLPEKESLPLEAWICIESFSLILFSICLNLFSSFLVRRHPEKIIRAFSLPVSLLLLPCIPFFLFYLKGKQWLSSFLDDKEKPPFRLKDKLLEYLTDSDLGRYLDKTETKLIHTVVSFKDRIVREVMVPRIDVFSLPIETTILEAAQFFAKEGYSRIPVYKESVDKIVGILLYKDILSFYIESGADPHRTVEHLLKPALYTPETKKIAGLLQEFRHKQNHLAIVVDEYGGTEGIVTIEDILEELVGEIEDEYDTQETKIYFPLSSGGWIVDAKIGIITLEEELNVKIPQSPEYDTIGGFIFHRTGSIPGQGWKIHLENVDLEVLTSDERSIQKVKITPVSPKHKKHS
jgi:CBS domain containing-hemolysin-like protein